MLHKAQKVSLFQGLDNILERKECPDYEGFRVSTLTLWCGFLAWLDHNVSLCSTEVVERDVPDSMWELVERKRNELIGWFNTCHQSHDLL